MSDEWKKREEAFENIFFQKKNEEALARLRERLPRKSPITGEPMTHKTILGVIVDECPTSGGIWLDKGELDQIMEAISHTAIETHRPSILEMFFRHLFGR
jgi:hypothetical protein